MGLCGDGYESVIVRRVVLVLPVVALCVLFGVGLVLTVTEPNNLDDHRLLD